MANTTLTGKSVIVTGGGSGIGLALVRYYASQACKIALLDISEAAAQALLPTLKTEYPSATFLFQKCDVSSWDDQKSAFEKLYKETGAVDIVCANAGVPEITNFLEKEEGEPQKPSLKTLEVNLIGTMYSIRLGVHYMRKNTGPQKGLIICTASNAGLYAFPMGPKYGASKHGVVGTVRSLAKPLEEDGIRINAVCPNVIATGLSDANLFASMKITPMSTLINTVNEFSTNTSLSGITAEISGDKGTFREQPEYVDEITKHNFDAFSRLGYC